MIIFWEQPVSNTISGHSASIFSQPNSILGPFVEYPLDIEFILSLPKTSIINLKSKFQISNLKEKYEAINLKSKFQIDWLDD